MGWKTSRQGGRIRSSCEEATFLASKPSYRVREEREAEES